MVTFVVVVPAYNEGYSIERCIKGVIEASELCREEFELKAVVVCVNGCTDNTETIVDNLCSRYPVVKKNSLPVNNYRAALEESFSYVGERYPDSMVVKLDADSVPRANSFAILLGELAHHPHLLIAGGHPVVTMPHGLPWWRRILAKVLAVRSFFPQGEVSALRVDEYHPLAHSDQQAVGPAFETRSKIYFHGRFWAARHAHLLHLPQRQLGDDVYLTARLYHDFGPGVIRVRYDANCQFEPNYTLVRHFLTYRRINADLHRLDDDPELNWYVRTSRTRLDWTYIKRLSLADQACFLAYYLISSVEHIMFSIFPYRETDWVYSSKHPPIKLDRAE